MGGDRAQRMALAFVNPSNCFSKAHAVAKKNGRDREEGMSLQ